MEGEWPASQSCAPFVLLGWVDQSNSDDHGIAIPCLLSFLAYFNVNASGHRSRRTFPSTLWPPLQITFQAYHLMVDLGMLFILIGIIAPSFTSGDVASSAQRWVLWLLVASVFLTELATLAGWWTAEFGRQPWVVFNLLKTSNGVSPTLNAYNRWCSRSSPLW